MSTPGSRTVAIGLAIMMLSVSAGIHSGARAFGSLICFTGVLAGANLIAVGVHMANVPAPNIPVAFDGARAPAAFVRSNIATVGLVMASCAVTVVSDETEPVLCFATFALLLLGVSLINMGSSW